MTSPPSLFVEAPDKRNTVDGVRLLEELGAITDEQQTVYKLTPLGRQLSQRWSQDRARRVWFWKRKTLFGCVREAHDHYFRTLYSPGSARAPSG